MLVAIIAKDKPNHLETRLANREAHLAHFKGSGCLQMAGPFLDDAGAMCGSLLILEVDDLAQAQALADADPYAVAGLFAEQTVLEWKKVLG